MFTKYWRIILLLIILFNLFSPNISYSANLDSRCWDSEACKAVDPSTGLTGVPYGSNPETIKACGNSTMVFCSAGGAANTEVGFGGNKVFNNFGEMIKWFYTYGIRVAAILAVIMIIAAGFEWVTSGGNTEKISSAHKRIGGALMGLFLAVMAYFILNMVNPYLINLRMPQTWKTNSLGIAPSYCKDLKAGKMVSAKEGGPYDVDPQATTCGSDYYVQGTNMKCKGTSCGTGFSSCARYSIKFLDVERGHEVTPDFECVDQERFRLIIYLKLNTVFQNFAAGSWWLGQAKTVVTSPAWLDVASVAHEDGASYWVRCKSGKVGRERLTSQSKGWDGWFDYRISFENGRELVNSYYELDYFITDDSIQKLEEYCESPDVALNFYISHEVDVAGSLDDKRFYLSPASSNDDSVIVIGTEKQMESLPGFSIEKLKTQSIFGVAEFTEGIIERIDKNG